MKINNKNNHEVIALNKTEIINSIQKKSLKIVLYRNQYIPTNSKNNKSTKSTNNKSTLIQELLANEKNCLKLRQEHESVLETDEFTEKVKRLVEQKKADIFTSYNDSDLDSIGSPPAKVLRAIKKQKDQQQAEPVPFTVIPKYKMTKFLALISSKEIISKYERESNLCSGHMHTQPKRHWNSPLCTMKAIQDSILRRKWHNLTQLLLMVLNLTPPRYTPMIRYICLLVSKLNPVVQEHGLADQFTKIQQTYRKI